ncbi:MAG: adenosine deaminase, partial [bacterium]
KGATQDEMVDAVLQGLERGREEFNVPVNLILCMYRGTPAESSMELAKLAVEYKSRGIAGVDFAGDESQYGAHAHKEAFDLVRKNGIPITIHAGEAGSVDNIREAIKLGAARIGHGVRLIDDEQLMQEVIEKEIPLELCLTSNLQTQAVKSIDEHPFPIFYEKGVKVTINTDDPRVSNTDINEEFLLAAREFDFDISDLKQILFNSVEAAFIDSETKERLHKQIKNS